MVELEKTLISLATQRLEELRGYISRPDSDERAMRQDVLSTFISLSQLIEFSHVDNSGVSASGVAVLKSIESEMNKLCRTFTWLY